MTGATGATSSGRRSFFRFLRRTATLEIRGIPASTIQLKIGRRYLFFKSFLAAGRTCHGGGLTHLAHELCFMATACALIIVNWHRNYPRKNGIIPECKSGKTNLPRSSQLGDKDEAMLFKAISWEDTCLRKYRPRDTAVSRGRFRGSNANIVYMVPMTLMKKPRLR